jgi:hypothetical protein
MTTDNQEHQESQSLVEAAKAMGAYEVKKPQGWDDTKSIVDAIGDRHIRFFPELPKIEWNTIVNSVFRILTIKIINDWDNARFGKSSFPLFLIDFEDGRKGTTLGSGVAILNQAIVLSKSKVLPVKVRLIMKAPDTPGGQPYYFLDGVK